MKPELDRNATLRTAAEVVPGLIVVAYPDLFAEKDREKYAEGLRSLACNAVDIACALVAEIDHRVVISAGAKDRDR